MGMGSKPLTDVQPGDAAIRGRAIGKGAGNVASALTLTLSHRPGLRPWHPLWAPKASMVAWTSGGHIVPDVTAVRRTSQLPDGHFVLESGLYFWSQSQTDLLSVPFQSHGAKHP